MSLTQQSINDLKQIHKEEYGEDLTDQEAWDMGIQLLNLAKALTQGEKVVKNK